MTEKIELTPRLWSEKILVMAPGFGDISGNVLAICLQYKRSNVIELTTLL